MEEVLLFLCSIHPLSPECLAYLRRVIKFRSIKEGDIILKIGEVNRHLYFIKKGLLHCHYFVKEKSVSAWFFVQNDTVVSIGSFYDQVPSEDCIEALEDGELFYITRDEFYYLCRTFHDFSYLANLLFIKYLKVFEEHSRLIRKHDAEERRQLLLSKFPELVQRVKKKLLASWLGMEKETISRGPSRKRGRKK